MIEVAPIVMTHPTRRAKGEALARSLGAQVSIDVESKGPWWNARQCWLTTPLCATHRLVIQDDAVPCVGFLAAVKAAIAVRPDCIVSFFTVRPELVEAKSKGLAWLAFDTFCSGLALAMPTTMAREMVRWRDATIDASWVYDDTSVLLWALNTGRRIWCTAPSLVQHDVGERSIASGRPNDTSVSPWYEPVAPANRHWANVKAEDVSGNRMAYLASRHHHLKTGATWYQPMMEAS